MTTCAARGASRATRSVPARSTVAHARSPAPPWTLTPIRRLPTGAARAKVSMPARGGRATMRDPETLNGAYSAPRQVCTSAPAAPARRIANSVSASQRAAARESLKRGRPPHAAEFSSSTRTGRWCRRAIASSGPSDPTRRRLAAGLMSQAVDGVAASQRGTAYRCAASASAPARGAQARSSAGSADHHAGPANPATTSRPAPRPASAARYRATFCL
jgi:hypothetical protein